MHQPCRAALEAGCEPKLTSRAAPGGDALPAGDVPPSEGDAASARPALLAPLAAGLAPPPPASRFGAGYDFAGELAHVRRRAVAPRPGWTPASSCLLSCVCACRAPLQERPRGAPEAVRTQCAGSMQGAEPPLHCWAHSDSRPKQRRLHIARTPVPQRSRLRYGTW